MTTRIALWFGLTLSLLAVSPFAFAEDDASGEHILGNWGGIRTALEDKGVTVESILTLDSLSNVSGGVQRNTAWLGNYDLTATFDTEKMGLWSGGTLFAYFLGDFGDEISKYSGEAQVVDNIEAYSTAKLYEFWYEHSFGDGKFSALVGLHDLNSEFYALDYAGTLLNSSFGIGIDVAQVGPSIFSTTSLAVRLKAQPTDHTYALTALYDGVPGDPEKPHGTHIKLKKDDGLFWANEAGIISAEGEHHYKAGLGFWYTNPKYEDFAGAERSMNRGLYTIGEATVYSEDSESEQGLGAFYQLGFAAGDRNQFSQYLGAGLTYTGLIPSRDEDVFSIALARAANSDAYRNSAEESDRAETVFEATYRAPITGYLSVQPDFQYVLNPSTDPGLKDSVVLGVRVELAM
ncbi:MAG: carbohydrate porin [Oligoflexia bacterium]|nr:carbohydrate porin [Oligoflexia bacterium]